MEEPRTFEEFWPYYVSQHLNPTCRTLHVVGTSIALAHAAVGPLFPPAFLAAPVWGYGLAWIGHYGFEKNRPATFGSWQHAKWSLRGDFRMLKLTLLGRMEPELQRARELYSEEGGPDRARPSNGAGTIEA